MKMEMKKHPKKPEEEHDEGENGNGSGTGNGSKWWQRVENRAAFCLAGAHLDLWQEVCTIRTDIGDAITWRIYTNVFGEKLSHATPSAAPMCVCVRVCPWHRHL